MKLCKIEMDNGKFVFRYFLAKRNVKHVVYFAVQFLGDEKSHSPNRRGNCDLRSPGTIDTHGQVGEC